MMIADEELAAILLQMQSTEQSSAFVIEGRDQAAAFSHPLRVRVLMLCASDESSLSALHKRLEVPISKLHYHVSRLVEERLLLVSRTEPRAGRGIKYYRSAAESFIVPQDQLAELPSDKWSAQLRQSLRNEQGRSDERMLHYTAGPNGKVLVKLLHSERSGPSRGIELWRLMQLSGKQRTSLARELGELLERYAASSPEAGAESFLVHAAFGPARS
jgi:hypothetical protein